MILLVAEDEALIALVLALELRGAGHQVLGPAATPEEGAPPTEPGTEPPADDQPVADGTTPPPAGCSSDEPEKPTDVPAADGTVPAVKP